MEVIRVLLWFGVTQNLFQRMREGHRSSTSLVKHSSVRRSDETLTIVQPDCPKRTRHPSVDCLQHQQKNGSSGRTRTYNPPVNSRFREGATRVFNDLNGAQCLFWSAFGDKRFQVWSRGTVPIWNEECSFLSLRKVLQVRLPCR